MAKIKKIFSSLKNSSFKITLILLSLFFGGGGFFFSSDRSAVAGILNSGGKESSKPVNQLTAKTGWLSPGAGYNWIRGWKRDSMMNVLRGSASIVAARGHIYVMGGGGFKDGVNLIHASVEYARIMDDGSLGPWLFTAPMKTRRVFASAVAVNGYIYVFGGERGYEKDELLDTVERARILPDGSLGEWVMEKFKMNTPRRALVTSFHEGSIYALGGYNGVFLNDVERTEVLPDGSLKKWEYEEQVATSERYVHTGLIHKNNIYLFGGHVRSSAIGTETAEWASFNRDGSVSKWSPLPPMLTKRLGGRAVAFNDNLYIIGGHNTIPLSSVERAVTLEGGALGEWERDTPLTDVRVGPGIAAYNNVVYAAGGSNEGEYLRSVLRAYYSEGRPLGYWSEKQELYTDSIFKREALPLDAKKHFDRGWLYMTEKQYESAALEYELGIQIMPDLPQPYNMLGTALHEAKLYEKAVDAYEKAIKFEPKFGPFFFNRGNSYLALNRKVEAEKMFRKAVELSPGYLNAKIRLFQLLAESGRCSEIAAPLKELSTSYPQNSYVGDIEKSCM